MSKQVAAEIHEKAAPFITWLQEAEEETEDEDDDENLEVWQNMSLWLSYLETGIIVDTQTVAGKAHFEVPNSISR